jgi:hypothetical protein
MPVSFIFAAAIVVLTLIATYLVFMIEASDPTGKGEGDAITWTLVIGLLIALLVFSSHWWNFNW